MGERIQLSFRIPNIRDATPKIDKHQINYIGATGGSNIRDATSRINKHQVNYIGAIGGSNIRDAIPKVDAQEISYNPGTPNERDAIPKVDVQEITYLGNTTSGSNQRDAVRLVKRLKDGDYWRTTLDPISCPPKQYRLAAWNTNTNDWETWLAEAGPNLNNPSEDPIIDIMVLDEFPIEDDNYWKTMFPTNICSLLNYKMIAWNLTTEAWETWIAEGEPNSNNPSGEPITNLMIAEVF